MARHVAAQSLYTRSGWRAIARNVRTGNVSALHGIRAVATTCAATTKNTITLADARALAAEAFAAIHYLESSRRADA